MRPKIPTRPSKRSLAAYDAFASGQLDKMPAYVAPKKRGKQPESASNDAVKQWANYRNGILYRNRRGMVDMPWGKMPFGLGPNGYGDNVGYLTITVTPEMVGRKIAVFSMIECKRADKALSTPDTNDHQEKMIQEVRSAGGFAGFARQAEDAERLWQEWLRGLAD